jgi:hypothetical protein
MGLYDDIRVLCPLPGLDVVPGGRVFQTKSLECVLDNFEIRENGTLWHENYETVWHEPDPAKGPLGFMGAMEAVNRHWVLWPYTGEVRFHDMIDGEWFDFSAYFMDGRLRELNRLAVETIGI